MLEVKCLAQAATKNSSSPIDAHRVPAAARAEDQPTAVPHLSSYCETVTSLLPITHLVTHMTL